MRILIADDHPFTLMGTKAFVESLGYKVEDVCSNGITAFNLISSHQPAVAILDINMPGMDGLEVLEKVYRLKLLTRVILLTMHKEMTIFRKANQWGVAGYILKENAQEELQKCIEIVKKGGQYISKNLENDLVIDTHSGSQNYPIERLTFTEKKVLELIAQQKTSKQIADMLFISEKTVEGHRTSIIQKLELPKEKNILLIWATRYFK
ncbi:response regulator transcription factor [Emticicia sp. BO119]|uniref:response regulator n=1 Tax=Emticicia sp. BO119 TaxID=2757768 RepID=UPI0015F04DFC|nr:response regulator transcription factor [Emticicia sp. BO119]MBA4851866.1 response regulator transcription factor [Emticicia sp. BO119]